MSVAFLGCGLMGAGFVKGLLGKKIAVNVWNRSHEKAKALEADGAKAFVNVADAVKGVERVHIALSDDASVDAVLEAAQGGLSQNVLILDHTTCAPQPTLARIAKWRARGFVYVHVPMFMGPKNALEATGLMLVSCPLPIFERIQPILQSMTGKLLYMGAEREDKAAAFKLFGNMSIFFVTAALADIYNLGAGLGIDPKDVHTLFDSFKPAGQIEIRGKKMATGEFLPPGFELTMARKDALETAEATGTKLEVFPAIAAQMDKNIAQGFGASDLAAISHEALERFAQSQQK